MTIQPYQERGAELAPTSTQISLAEWAQSARAAHTVATSLVQTSFVPAAFRGKPEEATAAILSGAEVGLSPMASLRSFDIIQGQAAPRAVTLRAIVQSQGHDVWVVESTETRAVVAGTRRGTGREQRSTWTMDRAKRLGLDGKDNWKKQPGAMLVARATSEVCRLIASDAILGLPYSTEELQDGVTDGEPVRDITPATTNRRVTRRVRDTAVESTPDIAEYSEPTATLAVVPDADPGLPPLPFEEETGDFSAPITKPQLTKLQILMKEAGLDDREQRLNIVQKIIGREIDSSTDLTKDEASSCIESFTTGAWALV